MKRSKIIWTPLLIATVIERFVNHPNLSLQKIGERFGLDQKDVSRMLSKHYFGPGKNGEIITKPSSINQLIHKTA